MIYSTNLCNSHCKHCLVWKQRPVKHLSKDKIIEIMQSRCISKHTTIGLEGGEFLLHPQAKEILQWFSENHPKFELLSNGLQPQRLVEAVKNYPPQRLYLSLDGAKESYAHMRGTDGYDKVMEVIEKCKDLVPLSLMFTLSPYNSFDDLKHVVDIALKYDIDVRIGIYNDIDFFNTVDKAHNTEIGASAIGSEPERPQDFKNRIPENVKCTSENYDFLLLYDEWKNKRLRLNCFSIFDSLVIHPDGKVPVCQNLGIYLGNLYQQSLDEIYNGQASRRLQKQYARTCNRCWINFHRKYDIVLLRSLERILPKPLIEFFYGKYQWSCDKRLTYKCFLEKYS